MQCCDSRMRLRACTWVVESEEGDGEWTSDEKQSGFPKNPKPLKSYTNFCAKALRIHKKLKIPKDFVNYVKSMCDGGAKLKSAKTFGFFRVFVWNSKCFCTVICIGLQRF